jgi:hypothetical protein
MSVRMTLCQIIRPGDKKYKINIEVKPNIFVLMLNRIFDEWMNRILIKKV